MWNFIVKVFLIIRSFIGLVIGLLAYGLLVTLVLSIFGIGSMEFEVGNRLIMFFIVMIIFAISYFVTHEDFRREVDFSTENTLYLIFVYLPFFPIISIWYFIKGIKES